MIGNPLKRLLSWRALGMAVAIIAIATLINLYGIHILGGLEQWEEWRKKTYWYFFAWRILLYSTLIWGWIRVRPGILRRSSSDPARLRRAELLLATSVLLMEITRALPHLSQEAL
ncbi:hypothetical protein K5D34_04410 [Pseudomonas cichorii]|nr:hypothetical protein [Pseudomonas cichorii]MBX8508936.1 hypothetical protein [Pseudomonas cichorii]MBX8524499.1 hypothetical protein [Pseudomonas cichorii]MBX8554325.1 hypothetical protein [Pseudomonas cichorii]